MSDEPRLRVLFDTTVFCGALVKPEGGNMRCLLLANAPLFHPVISQAVLAEFIHSATVRGLGKGAHRRFYTYQEAWEFLHASSPLLDRSVPVGLRDILPLLNMWPYISAKQALQNMASQWPSTSDDSALSESTVADLDAKDAHVMLAVKEYDVDVLVTSNVEDFTVLAPACSIEPPSKFLQRWSAPHG